MTAFHELGLLEPITRALTEERYEQPTPIQAQTIPHLLAGRDVVGIAQTGTGKTAAFALPILNHLASNRERAERKTCRVLVLSPTRELSGQIVDSFKTYGRHVGLSVTLAIGGVPIGRQQRALANGVDVLVATPGRLLDLIQMGAVRIDRVGFFVLDEADRMLDMGFIHDIRKIVGKLPKARQSLFFSATMPREIEDLARDMLRDPARVAVTPVASTAERISQRVIHVDKASKSAALAAILRNEKIERVLVFTRTKHGADRVVRQLQRMGLESEAIHGNKSQNQRERVLMAFREGKIRTLIATDIAARGIDVDGVSHVVNYDLPNIAESYVHRIGRTARAGAEGIAISLCDNEERAYLRQIEKLIRMSIPATTERHHAQRADHQPRQRQEPRPQPAPAPKAAEEGGEAQAHQPRDPHAKPHRGHRHHNGRRGQGGRPEGRDRHERPAQGRDRHERSAQGRDRNGRPGGEQRDNRPAQGQNGRSAQGQNGEMSGMAFMQKNRGPRRKHRPGQARAPH